MKPVLLPLLLAVAACGDLPAAQDAAPSTCQELREQFSEATQSIDRSCDTVDDCGLAGGPYDWTCNCTPALVDYAVNRAAYAGSPAADLETQFDTRCADDPDAPAVCDWGPPDLACVDSVCVFSELHSCLEFDAGV